MNSYFPNPFIFPKQKKNCRRIFPAFPVTFPPIVRDRFLYVANQNKNMIEIYNISNPIFPVHVGEFNGENLNIPSGLATTGNILYVANAGDNTIEIYNISNPMDPIRIRGFNEGNLNARMNQGWTSSHVTKAQAQVRSHVSSLRSWTRFLSRFFRFPNKPVTISSN